MKVQYISDSNGNPTDVIIPIDQWNAIKSHFFEDDNGDEQIYNLSKAQEQAINVALQQLEEGKGIPHEQVMMETRQRFPEYFKS